MDNNRRCVHCWVFLSAHRLGIVRNKCASIKGAPKDGLGEPMTDEEQTLAEIMISEDGLPWSS